MTPSEVWWLLPPDPAAPHRRRHHEHLEHLFGGPRLATTAPPRFCPDHSPAGPDQPCRMCRILGRRFDAWIVMQ